jgi:hypothetical protein
MSCGTRVHVEADFGPEFDWTSGENCDLDVNLGSLSAGVDILGKAFNTPSFTPFKWHLWSGCTASGGGGGGAGGGGGGPTVSVTSPGNQTSTVGNPVSLQIQASDSDGGTLSYSAAGLPAGLTINPTTGLITGTPTAAGTPSVTVTAKDATGPSGNTTFSWTINPTGGGGGGFAATVAVGRHHTCALLPGGQIDCWGYNGYGELGNGTTTDSDVPVAVSGITNATQIASSDWDTCALLAGGQIDCWG